MKKLSFKRRIAFVRTAQARWKKDLYRKQLRKSKKKRKVAKKAPTEVRIIPPSVFSFSNNYDATVNCLRELKAAALKVDENGHHETVFLDLEPIQEISVAGALVLAAEIDRWRLTVRKKIKPRNTKNWNSNVHALLSGLGFFDLLGVTSPIEDVHDDTKEITVLPMVSSTLLDARLLKTLSQISEVLHKDPSVYDGLVEAAYNATKHAYPKGHKWEFLPATEGWWATASWNPANGSVKFIVYDQGVGIAATLPRWEGWEKVRELLSHLPLGSALNDSSKMIQAALEVDRTSLEGGHGKGLQDVVSLVDGFEGAKVRILSGTGELLYLKGGTVELRDHESHIGGTLVEWTIPTHALGE
ncbi:hypothetical protein [Cognatishimia activa]|uniref:hypothetical protein n=1 Tax=Cognatishimia activa TaxID=1715691 RepID=UPI00222FC654|nr:hypothetical protein [Cognatishimia activa]UZD90330.1 hypothetical protein M0D42_12135 [Cognatishimia activa]